jgi:hypothetical protein
VRPANPLSRRSLLVASAAATGASLGGCRRRRQDGPQGSHGDDENARRHDRKKEPTILDLSFHTKARYRLFHLVAPGFAAVSRRGLSETTDLLIADASPPAPFAAVELDVAERAEGVVMAGLATGASDQSTGEPEGHLVAFADRVHGEVGIELRRDGRTQVLARTEAELPGAFRFAFALCENRVTVLVDTGDGWRPLLSERDAVSAAVDMRRPETLADHRYAWGARPGTGTVRFSAVRAGVFGMAGIRDEHLVQHADGAPYVRDGKAYFTATCAGLGFFQQAHWGVFTLDLDDPTRFEQVAQLYSLRDGLLLGDHAGQVVRDDENGRWIVATSSWGDFDFHGVHVRHVTTTDDVLHGVHVLETVPTPLPTNVSAWDPGMTKIDGRWHVSFVESPSQQPFDFHPALAVGPAGADWDEKLELAGAATDLHQCEGPIMTEVDGEWCFLASDGDARAYPVFDMRMRRIGELDAPYETNIPHPQIVPLPDGDQLMVTFDGSQYHEELLGYGTHGDVLVMRSDRGTPS